MAQGAFITFEGGEGAGRSTQILKLAEHLRGQGRDVVLTREPGGSPAAERVRAALLGLPAEEGAWTADAECLLHYAARRQHVADVIAPARAAGRWVVSDRFADSTAVYQGHAGGTPLERIQALHAWTFADDAKDAAAATPDLTLVLDIPVSAGRARSLARGGAVDIYERRPDTFHEAVRQGFLAIAAAEPARCVVIDANRPVDAVALDIARAADARLGGR